MRVIAVAGLVVVALGVGLWFLIVRDDGAKVVPDAKASTPKTDEAAPAPSAAVEMQPRKAPSVGAEIKKSIEAKRAKDERSAPSLVTDGSGSGSAKVATPADHMRWAMMKAVHAMEPAILDCLDQAKKAGDDVNAVSSYSYTFSRKGDEVVLESTTLEYGPYPATLNTCIQAAGKTTGFESMPENATRLKLINKLTVENGEIKNLQMPSYHVIE